MEIKIFNQRIVMLVIFVLFLFIIGCKAASLVDNLSDEDEENVALAECASVVAMGGNNMVSSVENTSQSANTNVTISSIKVCDSGTPQGFFTQEIGADGYIPVGDKVETIGVTPYIRCYDKNNTLINNAYLTGKKIADLGNFSWDTVLNTQEGQEPVGMREGMQSFINDPTYLDVKTFADYIVWMWVAPSVTQHALDDPNMPDVSFSTPAVTSANYINAMECKMYFSDSVSGSAVVMIGVKDDSSPEDGTYTGTGELTFTDGETEIHFSATVKLTFVNTEVTALEISGTDETTGKSVIITMNPSTQDGGTGIIKDSNGNTIATFTFNSTGGTVTNSATGATTTFTY